ncbi:hypothetical protein PENANT_c387G01730 [Penicillium antarcticum]|uniref:Uncharacterized protein n=1 Tax=Penicillium antarcticum TaxID=416450 RepID=A0A1V6NLQ6_9EURO|nr:hypothetical protein PENANT_c387G01730 [Penicillium antarcticum]
MAFSTSLLDLPASSIKDRWILDSGSSHSLSTGDGKISIIGQGTARLHGIDPITRKEKVITLSNVYYAPGFYVNLVSSSINPGEHRYGQQMPSDYHHRQNSQPHQLKYGIAD